MKKESNSLLPSLAELHAEPEVAFKNDKLNLLLWQPSPRKWVKKHPTVNTKAQDGSSVKLEYLPVDKVRYLLTRIFQTWKPEVISIQPMFNSVVVHIRVHYFHPVKGEWMFADGIGAAPMQVDKDYPASAMDHIKSNAVQIGAPAAKSYALKNAAEEIGNIFGASLNKWDIAEFQGSYMTTAPEEAKPEPKPASSTNTSAPVTPEFEL